MINKDFEQIKAEIFKKIYHECSGYFISFVDMYVPKHMVELCEELAEDLKYEDELNAIMEVHPTNESAIRYEFEKQTWEYVESLTEEDCPPIYI